MKCLGDRLRTARQAKGLSQRALANLAGITNSYLSKLEGDRADYPPKKDVLAALAHHLDLDPGELLYLSGRITEADAGLLRDLARMYPKSFPILIRALRDNPAIAREILG